MSETKQVMSGGDLLATAGRSSAAGAIAPAMASAASKAGSTRAEQKDVTTAEDAIATAIHRPLDRESDLLDDRCSATAIE
jgi:hypothetical protein